MDEYISREAVIKKIAERQDKAMYGIEDVAFYQAIKIIKEEPAADVQPVKHGKWIENTYKYIKELDAYFVQAKCTVCGRYSDKIDIYTDFLKYYPPDAYKNQE